MTKQKAARLVVEVMKRMGASGAKPAVQIGDLARLVMVELKKANARDDPFELSNLALDYAVGRNWIEVRDGIAQLGANHARASRLKRRRVVVLSQSAQRVLQYIKKVKFLPTYDQFQKELQMGRGTISRALKELKDKGLIPRS